MLQRLFGVYVLAVFIPLAVVTAPLMLLPGLGMRRQIARGMMRLAMGLTGLWPRRIGFEHLPSTPCVLVSNHCSELDGLITFACLPPRFTFVVKAESRKQPLFGFLLHRVGVAWMQRTDVRAGASTTRGLFRKLRSGTSLTIFPEGTIVKHPGLLKFRLGAFLIAARAEVPVVPAVLHGTRAVMPEGTYMARWGRLAMTVTPPLLATSADRDGALELMYRARAVILDVSGEPDGVNQRTPLDDALGQP